MFGYQSVRGFIFCAKTTVNNGSFKKTPKYGVVQNYRTLNLSIETDINNWSI